MANSEPVSDGGLKDTSVNVSPTNELHPTVQQNRGKSGENRGNSRHFAEATEGDNVEGNLAAIQKSKRRRVGSGKEAKKKNVKAAKQRAKQAAKAAKADAKFEEKMAVYERANARRRHREKMAEDSQNEDTDTEYSLDYDYTAGGASDGSV